MRSRKVWLGIVLLLLLLVPYILIDICFSGSETESTTGIDTVWNPREKTFSSLDVSEWEDVENFQYPREWTTYWEIVPRENYEITDFQAFHLHFLGGDEDQDESWDWVELQSHYYPRDGAFRSDQYSVYWDGWHNHPMPQKLVLKRKVLDKKTAQELEQRFDLYFSNL